MSVPNIFKDQARVIFAEVENRKLEEVFTVLRLAAAGSIRTALCDGFTLVIVFVPKGRDFDTVKAEVEKKALSTKERTFEFYKAVNGDAV